MSKLNAKVYDLQQKLERKSEAHQNLMRRVQTLKRHNKKYEEQIEAHSLSERASTADGEDEKKVYSKYKNKYIGYSHSMLKLTPMR